MDAWIAWLQISMALLLFVLAARLLSSLHHARRDARRMHKRTHTKERGDAALSAGDRPGVPGYPAAARLRGVSLTVFGFLRQPRLTLECALVPLLMRSLKIADELAASAATRGIERPGERISLRPLRLRLADGAVIALMLAASIGSVGFPV